MLLLVRNSNFQFSPSSPTPIRNALEGVTANPPDPPNLISANAAEAFEGAATVAFARAVAGGAGDKARERNIVKDKRDFTSYLAFFAFYLCVLCFRPLRPKMMRCRKIPAIFFTLLQQPKCVLKMRSKKRPVLTKTTLLP